jgi:hypothetical protein
LDEDRRYQSVLAERTVEAKGPLTEMVSQRVRQGDRVVICTNVNTAAARDMGNESAAKSIGIGRKINIVSAKLHHDIQIDRECFRT